MHTPNCDLCFSLFTIDPTGIGSGTHLHPDFGGNWNGGPFGIPYMVVTGSQAKVSCTDCGSDYYAF